jgi:hypothetical protein
VIYVAPAIRCQSHVVIISIIIIIVAIAVAIKHGTIVIIRGHISKSSQNCEALIREVFCTTSAFSFTRNNGVFETGNI